MRIKRPRKPPQWDPYPHPYGQHMNTLPAEVSDVGGIKRTMSTLSYLMVCLQNTAVQLEGTSFPHNRIM